MCKYCFLSFQLRLKFYLLIVTALLSLLKSKKKIKYNNLKISKMNSLNNNLSNYYKNKLITSNFKLFTPLLILEYITRAYGIILHLAYFYYAFKIKHFRSNKFIFLHHVNALNFLFCIYYSIDALIIDSNRSNQLFWCWLFIIILQFLNCVFLKNLAAESLKFIQQ